MSPAPLLRVTVEPLEETCLIRASGKLDRTTADRLSSALDAARADGMTALLDLSSVSFMDTAGLRVLLRWDAPSTRSTRRGSSSGHPARCGGFVELSGNRSQLPLVAPRSSMRSALPTTTPQRIAG